MMLQRVIYEMRWQFLLAEDGDLGFLTSDNPVALFDSPTVEVPGTGFLSSPDTYLTFPLAEKSACSQDTWDQPNKSLGFLLRVRSTASNLHSFTVIVNLIAPRTTPGIPFLCRAPAPPRLRVAG
jgi:hypothetical protein